MYHDGVWLHDCRYDVLLTKQCSQNAVRADSFTVGTDSTWRLFLLAMLVGTCYTCHVLMYTACLNFQDCSE